MYLWTERRSEEVKFWSVWNVVKHRDGRLSRHLSGSRSRESPGLGPWLKATVPRDAVSICLGALCFPWDRDRSLLEERTGTEVCWKSGPGQIFAGLSCIVVCGRSGTGKNYIYIINLLLFNVNNFERSSDTKSCSFCSISQQWSISQDWWVALLRPVSQLFTLEIKKTCLIRFHPKTLTKISKSKIENLKKFETYLKLTTTNHIFMLINDILFSESFNGILVLRSWTSSLSLWLKILLPVKPIFSDLLQFWTNARIPINFPNRQFLTHQIYTSFWCRIRSSLIQSSTSLKTKNLVSKIIPYRFKTWNILLKLIPTLAGWDIAPSDGWSWRRQFSFNLPYFDFCLKFWPRIT